MEDVGLIQNGMMKMSEENIQTPYGPISEEQFLEAIHWAHQKTSSVPLTKSNLLAFRKDQALYALNKNYEPKTLPLVVKAQTNSTCVFSIYFLSYVELKFFSR